MFDEDNHRMCIIKCLEELNRQITELSSYQSEFELLLRYCYFDMMDLFRVNFPSEMLPDNLGIFENNLENRVFENERVKH